MNFPASCPGAANQTAVSGSSLMLARLQTLHHNSRHSKDGQPCSHHRSEIWGLSHSRSAARRCHDLQRVSVAIGYWQSNGPSAASFRDPPGPLTVTDFIQSGETLLHPLPPALKSWQAFDQRLFSHSNIHPVNHSPASSSILTR